uniref:Uncharacterized protein n=1 Tax=Pristionchus pacificus TaxID=54126 RepID=A0A2A6B6L4_PRIPA|eukprot:PDM61529.1 hypothetical protein PRIPAC_50971 [Pristionchus pacificus]
MTRTIMMLPTGERNSRSRNFLPASGCPMSDGITTELRIQKPISADGSWVGGAFLSKNDEHSPIRKNARGEEKGGGKGEEEEWMSLKFGCQRGGNSSKTQTNTFKESEERDGGRRKMRKNIR